MPVVPWKTRKKDSELIARLYEQNQELKQRLRSRREETLREVRDLIDEHNLSLEEVRKIIGQRIQNASRPAPE